MKKILIWILTQLLCVSAVSTAGTKAEAPTIENWAADSPAMVSIVEFVENSADEDS